MVRRATTWAHCQSEAVGQGWRLGSAAGQSCGVAPWLGSTIGCIPRLPEIPVWVPRLHQARGYTSQVSRAAGLALCPGGAAGCSPGLCPGFLTVCNQSLYLAVGRGCKFASRPWWGQRTGFMAGIACWLGTQIKQNCQRRSQATRLALQVGRSSGWNPLGHHGKQKCGLSRYLCVSI